MKARCKTRGEPGRTQGSGRSRGGRVRGRMKRLDKGTHVECSGEGRWIRAGDVVADLVANKIALMGFFSLKCVYAMLTELRLTWKESQDENKALREMISILSDEIRGYMTQISEHLRWTLATFINVEPQVTYSGQQ